LTLIDRERSSYNYLLLTPRVSLPPPPQSAVQISMSMVGLFFIPALSELVHTVQ